MLLDRHDHRDSAIFLELAQKHMARTALQVGDYLELHDGTYHRVAHIWDDSVQPNYMPRSGSFYLGQNGQSYSGSLGEAWSLARIHATDRTMPARFWFWHHAMAGRDQGVEASFDTRIWKVQPYLEGGSK